MRRLGLIGGMSWESTRTYYEYLNRMARVRLGGLHSASLVLSSVDFGPIEACMKRQDWDELEGRLCEEARRLERAGAEAVVLCTNTMHKLAPAIEAAVAIEFLHIADCLGAYLQANAVSTVGVLGTRFTMQESFYSDRLRDRFGINTLVPNLEQRADVDRVIFEELCIGRVEEESRELYLDIMDSLANRGAGAIAFACTEIELLVRPEHTEIPFADTTRLHAQAASDWAFADPGAATA